MNPTASIVLFVSEKCLFRPLDSEAASSAACLQGKKDFGRSRKKREKKKEKKEEEEDEDRYLRNKGRNDG